MKRFLVVAFSVMLLWFGVSCSMDMGQSPSDVLASSDTTLPTEPSDSEKSLLRIAVPTVSSAIMDSLNATYQPTSDDGVNSRAILQASSVDFTLSYPAGSGMADYEWTVTQQFESVTPQEDNVMMVAAEEVVPGNDLVLTAKVYNSNVSTSVPVVTGTSAPFSVGPGGSVDVPITAIPFQPVDLAGPSATVTAGPFPQLSIEATEGTNGPSITLNSLGGEEWYKVTPSVIEAGRYARLRFDPTESDAMAHFYGELGGRLNDNMMAWGYEMESAMMAYLAGDTTAYPTSTRAGAIVPLFDVPDPDDASKFYDAPDSYFYAGLSLLGINNAESKSANVEYDELTYDGTESPANLLDFDSADPVVIAATTPAENVFYPSAYSYIDGDTGEEELELSSEGSHFYRLDMADLSQDSANDIDISLTIDVCTTDFIYDLSMPIDTEDFDPTVPDPIENLYQSSTFLLMWRGTDGATTPTEYYDQITPNSFDIVEETDRDAITANFTVDAATLPGEVDPSTVEFILVLRSYMGGNGYSVSWVNNTPGTIIPWIE